MHYCTISRVLIVLCDVFFLYTCRTHKIWYKIRARTQHTLALNRGVRGGEAGINSRVADTLSLCVCVVPSSRRRAVLCDVNPTNTQARVRILQ